MTQNKLRNETGAITIDPTDIKRITREYYEHFNKHEFNNLDEIGQFFTRIHMYVII